MSTRRVAAASRPWVRLPDLGRYAPVRGIGGVYRSAEIPGGSIGGVPLTSAEDAVVAAVRMGYRVAETHIDRAGRLARRLRSAGERSVGPEPERQAVDATEKLVGKALMTGLGWLEGVAAEPGSPIARFAAAQYKLLGSALGVAGEGESRPSPPPMQDLTAAFAARADGAATLRSEATPRVAVVHRGGARRTVEILGLHLEHPQARGTFPLLFYQRENPARAAFRAHLILPPGEVARLEIKTEARTAAGVWRAALCDEDEMQQGWLEIVI